MGSIPHPGLTDALDSNEQQGALLPGRDHRALNGDVPAQSSQDFYGERSSLAAVLTCICMLIILAHSSMFASPEEHIARVTAEGQAVDYSRRLAVAQEQLAEYAAQKEEDAANHWRQAQTLESLLKDLLSGRPDSQNMAQLQSASDALCQKLAEEAGEAKNFAAQQKADVERAKRSSSMVWHKLCVSASFAYRL